MNTNSLNNATILTQDSTPEEYAELLRGRHVTGNTPTNMDCDGYTPTPTPTLNNGDVLTLEANEGCGDCANGWHHAARAYYHGNQTARIMDAHVENNQDDGYLTNDADGWEPYTIFVLIDGNQTQLPLAVVRGDDEPGAYDTGITLTVRRGAATRA